jgi:putative methionine-R-sulfoxide reductase with GAF domain
MAVDYQSLNKQLAALIADEKDALANSANFVGLL